MQAYIILIIAILLVFIIVPKNKFTKIGLPMLFVILAVFYGIRNNIGNDDQAYIWMYQRFSKSLEGLTTAFSNIEIGYKLLSRMVGVIFNTNFKGFFLICSVISHIFLYKFVKKLELSKSEMFMFILVYLGMIFITYLIIMRQFLSIAISMYALYLFKEKKYKTSLMFMVFASIFHISALITLVVFPIFSEKVKINKKFLVLIPIISFILGMSGIANNLINFAASITKYGVYAQGEMGKAFEGSGITHYFFILLYLAQFFIHKIKFIQDKPEEVSNSVTDFIKKGEMVYLSVFFLTINSGFALRVSYIYLIFLPLIVITFIRNITNEKYRKVAYILLCIVFGILIYKGLIIGTQGSILSSNDFSLDFWGK